MRVIRTVANARVLQYDGTNRYVVFHMTTHPYAVHTDKKLAAPAVKWAAEKHAVNGKDYVVLDSHNGDIIATFPRTLMERLDDRRIRRDSSGGLVSPPVRSEKA